MAEKGGRRGEGRRYKKIENGEGRRKGRKGEYERVMVGRAWGEGGELGKGITEGNAVRRSQGVKKIVQGLGKRITEGIQEKKIYIYTHAYISRVYRYTYCICL